MKRELQPPKRSSNSDSSKRLTYIKKNSFNPASMMTSSSSSSITTNSELTRATKSENDSSPQSSFISQNAASPSKRPDDKIQKASVRPKTPKNNLPIKTKEAKAFEKSKDGKALRSSETGIDQGKFSSPWVLSGDEVNMMKVNKKNNHQSGTGSKLPVKLHSTKLNRSRSNLSGCKSPHLRSALASRRSVSRSHSKLSGSRKNLIPPVPPVRTVSLKNNPRTTPGNQSQKQRGANNANPVPNKNVHNGNESSDKSIARKDKKTASEFSKLRQNNNSNNNANYNNMNNNAIIGNHHPLKNEPRRRFSEEIEANLNYVNTFHSSHDGHSNEFLRPKNLEVKAYGSNQQNQQAMKRQPRDQLEFHENPTSEDDKGHHHHHHHHFLPSIDSVRLGTKFNFVVKKTGITERKVESNEYVTMDTIRKLKTGLNVSQSPIAAGSKPNRGARASHPQRPQGLVRLNSEPGSFPNDRSTPLMMTIDRPFARSRLGSVPTLPSGLSSLGSSSVFGDSTLERNRYSSRFAGRNSSCKRSMSDVGDSTIQRSFVSAMSRDDVNYSSQSLRLSQNSAFTPFASALFNRPEQELSALSRLKAFSDSQNRTLNRLHLLPFQDHALSRRRSYRLSNSSPSSFRSASSCFHVPLGRSTKEVQDLHKELEHAQSRINNLTSQLTSNVQVVASFEQNLEKMLQRLHSMNTKDSEISNMRNIQIKMNEQASKESPHFGRISRSCEDLLECESKRSDSSQVKKEGIKNWLMNSLSKAFLRNKGKADAVGQNMRQEGSFKDEHIFRGENNTQVHGCSDFPRLSQSTSGDEKHSSLYNNNKDSLQLNIRTKTGTAEITVKQFANRNSVYGMFVVIRQDCNIPNEKNSCKILAGKIEITSKTSWLDLDAKVQISFEEHLKKLDENSLDLSRESISNYNVGGLWRSIGDVSPEFLPCGYLVGECDSIYLFLKGFSEKCLDALSYETLHRKNVLRKLSRMMNDNWRLLIIGRPDNNESGLIKRIAHHSIKMTDSPDVIDLRDDRFILEGLDSFHSNKVQSNESKLLILKNVDKVVVNESRRINHAFIQDMLSVPKLRIVGEAEIMKDSILDVLENFHCWIWPDGYKNHFKRQIKRRFLMESQLKNTKSEETADFVVQWLCSFADGFHDLKVSNSSKDFRQILLCPSDRNSAQAWFRKYWRVDLHPKYFSKTPLSAELSSFVDWVESSWIFKNIND